MYLDYKEDDHLTRTPHQKVNHSIIQFGIVTINKVNSGRPEHPKNNRLATI